MRDADATIERLLAGLRDAQPPAGLERRILEALDGMEGREAAASASFWRPAMALVLACAVIVMVALTVQHRKHAPGEALVPLKPKYGLNGAPNTFSSLRVDNRRRQAIANVSPRAAVKHPHDVPPLGETASFPAPPLPLTEQERLLLRLAHRGDAENMAILNPNVRAAQTAKATAQFQQFFAINATEMRSQSE